MAGIFLAIVLIAAGLGALRLAFPPPAAAGQSSTALPPAGHGLLAEGLKPLLEANPGLTGILPLSEGIDAFIARMALVRAATTSIDARYYIWHRDMTGIVLMRELLAAAERGVKVRLLVDDNGTPGFDAEMAAFARHPNMEVRIFNPFMLRRPRLLNYAFDFFRLNRRMHNKSLTVDGLATIVGGRNVGDEYFAAGDSLFIDLDVLAVGDAVPAVADDFDAYWASRSAIPARTVLAGQSGSTDGLLRDAAEQDRAQAFADYRSALRQSKLIGRVARGDARADISAANAGDLDFRQRHESGAGRAVGRHHGVGEAEPRRIEAEAFGILVAQRDRRCAGIHHHRHRNAVDRGVDFVMAVLPHIEHGRPVAVPIHRHRRAAGNEAGRQPGGEILRVVLEDIDGGQHDDDDEPEAEMAHRFAEIALACQNAAADQGAPHAVIEHPHGVVAVDPAAAAGKADGHQEETGQDDDGEDQDARHHSVLSRAIRARRVSRRGRRSTPSRRAGSSAMISRRWMEL